MTELFFFIGIGFVAQLIDGCLGMAYGVFSTSTLITMGVSLPVASTSVHFSEIFITFASGFAHLKFKNIDIPLLKKVAIPGVVGGVIGAYFLYSFQSDILKKLIAIYLLILGVRILVLVCKTNKQQQQTKSIPLLGFLGGFLDALGGGGWGPIVNTTLIAQGNSPKRIIGTTSVAEFFVTVTQSMMLFSFIGLYYWEIIFGLIVGGVCAAPISAYICQKIHTKLLMFVVAVVIIIMNLFNLCF